MKNTLSYESDTIKEVYVDGDSWEDATNLFVFLAGRSQSGQMLAKWYADQGDWKRTAIIGVTPQDYEWYPLPVGSHDQDEAIDGLPRARDGIEYMLDYLESCTGIERRWTVLAGFSAGGVMAIEVASRSDEAFQAVVCHSGTILEPKNLPECFHMDMPVLLTHQLDDDCFDWRERYWPMKKALIDQDYNLYVIERVNGNHQLLEEDAKQVAAFVLGGSSCFEKV